MSIIDEHYGGPRRGPARAIRARSGPERAFLALGPIAEAFLRDAAAAGTTKLGSELALIVSLEVAWGRDALLAALERAVTFRRFKAADVRSILEAGVGVVGVAEQGAHLDARSARRFRPVRSTLTGSRNWHDRHQNARVVR